MRVEKLERRIVPAVINDMTLRDWFAGQALASLFEDPMYQGVDAKGIAEAAYYIADAMLKARESK